MFYPIGWYRALRLDHDPDSKILNIITNSERELCLILTTTSVHLWNPRPAVEIACHRRSKESIDDIGCNKHVAWKIDSSVFVIGTDKDQLLFFRLHQRLSDSSWSSFSLPGFSNLRQKLNSDANELYRLKCDTKNLKNTIHKYDIYKQLRTKPQTIPALSLVAAGKLDLSSIGTSCLMAAEEELIVGGKDGDFYGIHWNGNVDDKFPWSLKEIQINDDSRDSSNKSIKDIKFSSVLSGFAIVLNNGQALFMPLDVSPEIESDRDSQNSSPQNPKEKLVYLANDSYAICVEINHKYRLIAFGLENSKIMVCGVNELNTSIEVNHVLEFHPDKFHDVSSDLGAVTSISYSPDCFVLATVWQSGKFALWSLFGSLLFCSEQWSRIDAPIKNPKVRIQNLCWAREGYSLWLSTNKLIDLSETDSTDKDSEVSGDNKIGADSQKLIILSLAHSTISSSPHLTCSSDSIVLLSEDRIYIGPSVPHEAEFDNWFVVNIPYDYISLNYPIRYATVDRDCTGLAIAGNNAFALYSITTNEWTMFNKKSQESGFTVCGDIIWWNKYLVMSCYNTETELFEIRAYSSERQLDNQDLICLEVPLQITRMSVFENRLLVLYSDGTFAMFMMNLRNKPTSSKHTGRRLSTSSMTLIRNDSTLSKMTTISCPDEETTQSDTKSIGSLKRQPSDLSRNTTIQISPMPNLVISNLQANPYCISSIALTRLHFKNDRFDDSILLNYCGKLFLLERQLTGKRSDVAFKAVSMIATNVEQFWVSPEISTAAEMSYFRKSLWLSCGEAGKSPVLKVWLPLLKDNTDSPADLYVPDRIMLPIRCDIYPLAIRSSTSSENGSDDAIVLGAESDILYKDFCQEFSPPFPFSTVKRTCRVYLHRILRELLLKQHLGYYARKIAESCQTLPYFSHCFELLLHEVLEEEATSPVPLPDPMLPQVVEFIKKFPVYLETVVHCARKSELSMWSHLFAEQAVGNPNHLFQECLERGKLDTAASCLLILQSLDRKVSHKMLTKLIEAAKLEPTYEYLIEDLEKFSLRAELDEHEGSPEKSSHDSLQ